MSEMTVRIGGNLQVLPVVSGFGVWTCARRLKLSCLDCLLSNVSQHLYLSILEQCVAAET